MPFYRIYIFCIVAVHLIGTQATYGQSYPTWTQVKSLTIAGATLTKTNSLTAWNAGAISEEYTYGDGWIEFSFSAQKYAMMGLSNYNTVVGPVFNYGIYAHINGYLSIRENGSEIPGIGKNGSIRIVYTASDILRVERIGSTVRYKKNGVTFYTSTLTSTGALHVDCSFGQYQASIIVRNFELGMNWTGVIDGDWNKAGNWSVNRVPNALDYVTIGSCTTCPVLNDDANIGALKMSAGSSLNIGAHTISIGNSTSITAGQLTSTHGKIFSKDFTEVKSSSITGSIELVKTGGDANTWYGGNHLSPEVRMVNKSNKTWKLASQSDNEVVKLENN